MEREAALGQKDQKRRETGRRVGYRGGGQGAGHIVRQRHEKGARQGDTERGERDREAGESERQK